MNARLLLLLWDRYLQVLVFLILLLSFLQLLWFISLFSCLGTFLKCLVVLTYSCIVKSEALKPKKKNLCGKVVDFFAKLFPQDIPLGYSLSNVSECLAPFSWSAHLPQREGVPPIPYLGVKSGEEALESYFARYWFLLSPPAFHRAPCFSLLPVLGSKPFPSLQGWVAGLPVVWKGIWDLTTSFLGFHPIFPVSALPLTSAFRDNRNHNAQNFPGS